MVLKIKHSRLQVMHSRLNSWYKMHITLLQQILTISHNQRLSETPLKAIIMMHRQHQKMQRMQLMTLLQIISILKTQSKIFSNQSIPQNLLKLQHPLHTQQHSNTVDLRVNSNPKKQLDQLQKLLCLLIMMPKQLNQNLMQKQKSEQKQLLMQQEMQNTALKMLSQMQTRILFSSKEWLKMLVAQMMIQLMILLMGMTHSVGFLLKLKNLIRTQRMHLVHCKINMTRFPSQYHQSNKKLLNHRVWNKLHKTL